MAPKKSPTFGQKIVKAIFIPLVILILAYVWIEKGMCETRDRCEDPLYSNNPYICADGIDMSTTCEDWKNFNEIWWVWFIAVVLVGVVEYKIFEPQKS